MFPPLDPLHVKFRILTGLAADIDTLMNTALAYHEIVPAYCPYVYSIDCKQLTEHFKVLADVCGTHMRHRMPVISFDDGHASHHRYALPLLEQFGYRGTFFVIAGFIGKRSGFMSWDELRELHSCGHSVQSHGWSHVPLTACTRDTLFQELSRSKQTIEDRLSAPIENISIPYGRCNAMIFDACARAGYTHVYTSDPGASWRTIAGLTIHGRLTIHQGIRSRQLHAYVMQCGFSYAWLQANHKLKIAIKTLIGADRYHRVWCFLAGGRHYKQIQREYSTPENSTARIANESPATDQ
jgi:peptidoglycan/xylan/chitin deacetylase (PgdA/CDA1 family)